MARGKKIKRINELDECTILTASNEFYRHNRIKGLAEETQKMYAVYLKCFIEWCGADTLLSDIDTDTMDNYIYKKLEDGNKPVSVATNIVHLRRFFNFCFSRGYMEKFDITIPKYEIELKEPYTDEEMILLLQRPISNNWVNYFFATGQRLSTVLNIKVSHLDLDNAKVKVMELTGTKKTTFYKLLKE